jgi:predicted MFS family arabinose efflux permease
MTLAAFEAIATATAMPVVARELDALSGYTWAFNAYIVASLLAMVIAGLRCDATGPRGPIVAGIAAFAVGSVVAGAAPSMLILIVGRAGQGIGSGAVIVGLYVLIARAYPESLRPKAFSALAAAWVLPSLVGPLVAGWLADSVSWRLVFWIVPIFVIPPLLLLLPRLAEHQGGSPNPRARQRIIAGIVATAGLLAIQDGLVRVTVPGGLEAAIGFILILGAGRVLLPAGSLTLARGLPTTVMMRGLIAAGYFSAEVFLPLALVEIKGVSVTYAGLTLALGAASWAVGSFAQSRLSGSTDRSVAVLVGALVVAVSILSLPLVLIASVPAWAAAGSWALGAMGMGLSIPSISVQTMRLSPEADQGMNSAALQIVDSVLVVIGTALIGTVYAHAVAGAGVTSATYSTMWISAAVVVALAALLAPRMRPVTR